MTETCSLCHGAGRITDSRPCDQCGGRGEVTVPEWFFDMAGFGQFEKPALERNHIMRWLDLLVRTARPSQRPEARNG